ncbi:hypothetical protein ORD22_06120 [Sporosarcina sp. GW1-11]|uniref:hypothetical protein n=1 Tax=Sporosarcina sp. GW1-11 TaxID=2899126 RepID=UPI00294C8828|nr:hypothetical protein [Sporosarcina sp. GW1-11]MDV6377838.1 hypothetical protein [Sporosarcina sp. GW1-11]
MHLFLVGLTNLVLLAVVIQLVATPSQEKIFLPLIKLAIACWIIQFLLQVAGHKLL